MCSSDLIYYASRYRLVVEPFWLLLVAGGFAEAVLWLRSRRRLYSQQ